MQVGYAIILISQDSKLIDDEGLAKQRPDLHGLTSVSTQKFEPCAILREVR